MKYIKKLKDNNTTSIIVIYLTASDATLRERMKKRGDSDEDINRRIKHDKRKFRNIERLCDFVVNTDSSSIRETVNYINWLLKAKSIYYQEMNQQKNWR